MIIPGFDNMVEKLRQNPKTIVFPEGSDPRVLETASRLLQDNFLKPILLGNEDEVKSAAAAGGFDIANATIIDPSTFNATPDMVELFYEMRKSKGMTVEKATKAILQTNYFGTMLVKVGVADALLGGVQYATADILRPAFQIIKMKPGKSVVTSCFMMVRHNEDREDDLLAMGDCAINIDPNEDELVEISQGVIECAKMFGMDPRVAFLSYSTKGSGKGDSVDKVRNACEKAKALMPNEKIDGEIQFDAAVDPAVGSLKAKGSDVAGQANAFIFPDINAGNIGYKIAQRLGGFEAYGPVLMGMNAPINDLSRGCSAQEVYVMSVITASLA